MCARCKIMVAYHKPSVLLKSEVFVPIQVGRDIMLEKSKDGSLSENAKNWLLNNLIGDNTGDNISKLNRFFNEMSAIYWGWKNQAQLDYPQYIGLMHYRRHFIFSEKNYSNYTWLNNSCVYSYEKIDEKYKELLSEKHIDRLLNEYDIIVSRKYNANNLNDGNYYNNCKERFAEISKTSISWYEKMEQIVLENYPQYSEELIELQKAPSHYLCNMFVMKKELFDEYCEFAFDVLMKLYDEFEKENVDIWQARAIGFLAEFLTSIYISTYAKNNPEKVKELDLTYLENTDIKTIFEKFRDFIYSKRKYSNYRSYTFLGINFRVKRKKHA